MMMSRLKKLLNIIAPSYAYVPIFFSLGFGCLIYFASKPFLQSVPHFDFSLSIDRAIPFVPFFVLFYILAYLQWAWHYLYHYRKSREDAYHFAMTDVLGRLLCLVIFIVLPSAISRPEITGNDIWSKLTAQIYSVDTPSNLFPSLHCLSSWICFRAALKMKSAPKWYAPSQLVFSILVFASTVLIKQHFVVDIPAGIAAAEIGWFLSKRLRLWRFFEKIELPCVRRSHSKTSTT